MKDTKNSNRSATDHISLITKPASSFRNNMKYASAEFMNMHF